MGWLTPRDTVQGHPITDPYLVSDGASRRSLNEITKIKTRRSTILTIQNREVSTVEHLFVLSGHIEYTMSTFGLMAGRSPSSMAVHISGIRCSNQPHKDLVQRLCLKKRFLTHGDGFLRLVPAPQFQARVEVEFPGYPKEVFEGGLGDFPSQWVRAPLATLMTLRHSIIRAWREVQI